MNNQCTDRDLLALEPGLFTGGGFAAQKLAAGTGGTLEGAAFTSESADFAAAGLAPGMVLCVYQEAPGEALGYEILEAPSATELTVSVLRAQPDAPAIAPPPAEDLKYFVLSFAPQLAAAAAEVCNRLSRRAELRVRPEEFADSPAFRLAVATAALAGIFTARAAGQAQGDANWLKAEHYRRRHLEALAAVRLAADGDGDGSAEQTRTLGNTNLRRV